MLGENFTVYTIHGEEYFVWDGSLLQRRGGLVGYDTIQDEPMGQLYLHTDAQPNPALVRAEARFDRVKLTTPEAANSNFVGSDYIPKDEFDGLEPVDKVVPDHLVECPDGGRSAGRKDEPKYQSCIECGWQSDECVYDLPEAANDVGQ